MLQGFIPNFQTLSLCYVLFFFLLPDASTPHPHPAILPPPPPQPPPPPPPRLSPFRNFVETLYEWDEQCLRAVHDLAQLATTFLNSTASIGRVGGRGGGGGGCGRGGGRGDVVNLTGRDGHCVVDNSWVVGRWGGGGGRESAKRNIQNLPRLSRLVNVLLMEKRNSAVFSALLHVSKVTSLGGRGV